MVKEIEKLGTELQIRALRKSDALADSQVHLPGSRPARSVAGKIPHVFDAGTAKAAGLSHCPMVAPSGGVSGTPGTRSGRWLLVLPSGVSEDARSTMTLMGNPVRAINVEVTSHEPNNAPASPG